MLNKLRSIKIVNPFNSLTGLIGMIFIFSAIFAPNFASAQSENDVFGWAWSENIGWISFNSDNPETTANKPYKVTIDADTKEFSGYAYSENIDYISFNKSDLTDCPSGICEAKLEADNTVTGWARACAGTVNNDCNSATRTDGWDGWIKLEGTAKDTSPYGVSLNSSTNEFEGWAYGSDVVGWISFNCENCEGNSACDKQDACNGTHKDYKVYFININTPPSVSNLGREPNYCTVIQGNGTIGFEWTYSDPEGIDQSHYHFQVATNSGFNPEDIVVDLPDVFQVISDGGTGTTKVDVVITPSDGDDIDYNDTYYWRVKVKDGDKWSTDWEEGTNFTTPSHAYPYPDFTLSPESPAVDEIVQLCSTMSVCYDAGGPSCSGNSFSWSISSNGEFTDPVNGPTSENPQIKFTYPDDNSFITLQIDDSSGFSCPKTKDENDFKVKLPLPWWKEILPRW